MSNILVKVRVKTGSKKESVQQTSEDHFEMSVKEEPERNSANRRVIELLAAHFKVLPTHVHILKGHHRPSKILSIELP